MEPPAAILPTYAWAATGWSCIGHLYRRRTRQPCTGTASHPCQPSSFPGLLRVAEGAAVVVKISRPRTSQPETGRPAAFPRAPSPFCCSAGLGGLLGALPSFPSSCGGVRRPGQTTCWPSNPLHIDRSAVSSRASSRGRDAQKPDRWSAPRAEEVSISDQSLEITAHPPPGARRVSRNVAAEAMASPA